MSRFFPTAFEKSRDFFRGYPLSCVTAVAIIVHMQKIRNRSHFFKKILSLQYCYHPSEKVTPFRNFFQKKALPSTGVISKTTPRCVAAFGKNSEKHHLHTTDYQFFTPKTLHSFQKKLKNFYSPPYHITELKLFLSHFRLKSKLQ